MSHQITQTVSAPQVKIITMTEDELTAKMDDFRQQILSEIKNLLTVQTQTKTTSPAEKSRTGNTWVSAKELSEKYGVCEDTIWKWSRSGKIPQPARIAGSGCTRWNSAEVEQALVQKCA